MRKDCEECEYSKKDCLAYVVSLTPAELLEWCRHRKEDLHLSNGKIAEKTNTPKGTVDRLLNSKNTDFRFSTIQPIIMLFLDLNNKYDCKKAISIYKQAQQTIDRLEKENIHEKEIIENIKCEGKERIDYFKSQMRFKNRIIVGMAISLAVCVLLIGYALVLDGLNTDIGFLWR